jgi:uncharacterized protein involved in exopolysaccharide biosynthesis
MSPFALSSPVDRGRGLRYLVAIGIANAIIWGAVLFLLKGAPRAYTSQWSVMVLENAGKNVAPAADGTPPGKGESVGRGQDLKTSYQVIATTSAVRKAAAAKVGMTTEQFGTPQVVPVDGTSLLNFYSTGSTREEAQKKAYALHEAFEERLNQLRVQQAEEQETGFESSLGVSRKKLENAQLRLSDYKIKAGLASREQIDQLASNIESLRRQRAEALAQAQDSNTRSRQLAVDFNMSSRLAAEAFTLHADSLFQQYLKDYSEATASLANVSSKFGPNHPLVVRETARQQAAYKGLQERGQTLLGHPVDEAMLARLNLSSNSQNSSAREGLFKDVVTSEAERQGLAARIQELDRQIYQLEQRLSILAQRNSTLDALNRDVQIAEAVFSSQLAGLNSNAPNYFGSYPAIQMVAEPNLPERGTIPQEQSFLILGATASVLSTAGLVTLWLRKREPFQQWLQQFNRV